MQLTATTLLACMGLAMFPRAATAPGESAPTDSYGCAITLKFSWQPAALAPPFDRSVVQMQTAVSPKTRVRIRSGTWSELPTSFWLRTSGGIAPPFLRAGASYSQVGEMRLGCNNNRRYHFVFTMYSDGLLRGSTRQAQFYYPSETGWTTARTIDLGNLATRF
ncbi:MAG: hypothetical protein OEZ65_14660 [Gemmatimonadota bacterium]|nr:hypothetical protein [Gemmatimonadota bacterium]